MLGHQVAEEHLPDVNLIGEMGDVTELGKLVQLVLGCAVSCEKKQGEDVEVNTPESNHMFLQADAVFTSAASLPDSLLVWFYLR